MARESNIKVATVGSKNVFVLASIDTMQTVSSIRGVIDTKQESIVLGQFEVRENTSIPQIERFMRESLANLPKGFQAQLRIAGKDSYELLKKTDFSVVLATFVKVEPKVEEPKVELVIEEPTVEVEEPKVEEPKVEDVIEVKPKAKSRKEKASV